MAPLPNTRPNAGDEDPRPTKKPHLGEKEDSKEEKPKPESGGTDPMGLDDQLPQPTKQSPLVQAEDEHTARFTDRDPMAPLPNTRLNADDEDPRPTKKPHVGEKEDSKEEKPKPESGGTDPMGLDDQLPHPKKQSPLVQAEDEHTDIVENTKIRCSLCLKEGHFHYYCRWLLSCPPDAVVGDKFEIVCDFTGERLDAFPPDDLPTFTRAQRIFHWPL